MLLMMKVVLFSLRLGLYKTLLDILRGDARTSAIKKSERHSYGFPCSALQGFRGF